jgi:hypothetical protein
MVGFWLVHWDMDMTSRTAIHLAQPGQCLVKGHDSDPPLGPPGWHLGCCLPGW